MHRSRASLGRYRAAALAATISLIAGLTAFGTASADAACADGGGAGGDWPVFAHDVRATGFQPSEDTIGPDNVGSLEPLWSFQVAGGVEAPAVADGGCVFIGSDGGDIYAIEIDTGQQVWHSEVPTATTLSVANGRVFVQSGSLLTGLDASTGAQLWQRNFAPYGSIGSPLAAEDFVIFGGSGCSDLGSRPEPCKGYYALVDQATGDTIVDGYDVSDEDVERGMEGPGFWSHPSYDPQDKYIYFGTANVRSIAPENPHSNALLKIDADPNRATYGEVVGYFHSAPPNPIHDYPGGETLCGPSPASLVVAAVCIDDDDFPTTAVIYEDSNGDTRLGATHSGADIPLRTFGSFLVPVGSFFGIDPDTMSAVWDAPTTAARAAVSAYDGERIFYSSGYDGGLIAVDKDDGTVLWESNTLGPNVWQHVSAANGVVYTPSSGPAMLLAFDAETGETLLQRSLSMDVSTPTLATISGGVTIARNTVIIPTNSPLEGNAYLIAYGLPA